MNPKIWWYAARASGIVAWGLAAASVIWGLVLSTRSARQRMRPVWVLDLHRYLGALTVVAVGVHLGALVADSFVPFGWADLFVPGASAWRPVPSDTIRRRSWRIRALVDALNTRRPCGGALSPSFRIVAGRQMPPLTSAA